MKNPSINIGPTAAPIVSILMPVYNAEKYLHQSVASILEQKGVSKFEVIIIDDGSTDKSFDILQEMGDERFLILRQRENKGIVRSLNIGMLRTTAPLIARMDADDVMHPERLIKQINFMRQNPFLTACGTYFDYINEDSRVTGAAMQFPIQPPDVREAFKKFTAIGHPTAMFRKDFLFKLAPDLYSSKYPYCAEDLGLWLKLLSRKALLANLGEVLLHYRVHSGQTGAKVREREKEQVALVYQDWAHLVWPAKEEIEVQA